PAGFLIADDGEIGARNQLGLAARSPEWVTLSRGRESDVADETGWVNRDKSAETPQRGGLGLPRRPVQPAADQLRRISYGGALVSKELIHEALDRLGGRRPPRERLNDGG